MSGQVRSPELRFAFCVFVSSPRYFVTLNVLLFMFWFGLLVARSFFFFFSFFFNLLGVRFIDCLLLCDLLDTFHFDTAS